MRYEHKQIYKIMIMTSVVTNENNYFNFEYDISSEVNMLYTLYLYAKNSINKLNNNKNDEHINDILAFYVCITLNNIL